VRPLADQHGSELALEHVGDPVTVITDPRRVRQILLNLLSNAIKFGEGKPIHVHCRAREDGGVEIDVTDHGIGIPGEDLEKIFDEFVQLSQPNQHQGTGLGLPISRRLAQLLDGSLTVRSIPGEGSTFRLTLPAKVSEVGGVPLIEYQPNGAVPEIDAADLPPPPDLEAVRASTDAEPSAARRKQDRRSGKDAEHAGEEHESTSEEPADSAAHVAH